LLRVVALAKLYEDCYTTQPKPYQFQNSPRNHNIKTTTSNSNPNTVTNPNNYLPKTTLPPLLPTPQTKPFAKPNQIKRMSAAEMQLRREKSQCYTCDEKFSFNHKCPNRQLMVLQVDYEETNITSTLQIPDLVENPIPIRDVLSEDLHLSLDAFEGVSRARTIRFAAELNVFKIQVMVDGGSSDNFLQPRVAKYLKLEVVDSLTLKVTVGNGQRFETEGYIKRITVNIQGVEIDLPVFLLPISGADLIIGSYWLATVGPHIHDYKALNIQFYYKGKKIVLQGDKYHKISLDAAQYHHIRRWCNTDAIDECYTVQGTNMVESNRQMYLNLPENMEPKLAILLHTYRQIFDILMGLSPTRSHNHSIPLLEGLNPVKIKPYRYPHSQKGQIEKMIQEMLLEGIIQPSKSPFSSPIILVKKKDGTWRFCTNYRALNVITVKDSFPIPTADELIDELHGATYFSKMDLRSGYHQILLNPKDRYKTTFRTHQGHYEWLVMPFGLTNAPATFQSLMNQIFQGLLRKSVLVFFHDILIYSPDWPSHLQHLEAVLQVLQKEKLFAKLFKCLFGATEIDYLGHTISKAGIAMEKDKINAIKEWPTSTTLKQLRGFLGLTGYYRRFIKKYASLAAPLIELLKKDAFKWSNVATEAFLLLKEALISAPLLVLPNFTQPFTLETDALGVGIGVVLLQNGQSVAYYSKKLSSRQQKQSAYSRELYAVTQAIAKFRHYLLGHKFIIKTDQKSLKELLDQSLHTPEQQQWLPKFLGYDFSIQYKPGKENVVAYALLRSFHMATSEYVNSWLQEVKAKVHEDDSLQPLLNKHSFDSSTTRHYTIHQGVLYWKIDWLFPTMRSCAKK